MRAPVSHRRVQFGRSSAFAQLRRDRETAVTEDLRLTQPPLRPLFFPGASVGDFHGFLFLAAMGFVPLEQHMIFVGQL